MYIYRVVRQQLSIPGTGCYTTFGIAALQLLAGQWQKVRFIADVSLNQQLVETLAAVLPDVSAIRPRIPASWRMW